MRCVLAGARQASRTTTRTRDPIWKPCPFDDSYSKTVCPPYTCIPVGKDTGRESVSLFFSETVIILLCVVPLTKMCAPATSSENAPP